MIKIYTEDEIRQKDLNYEEILGTVIDTIKSSDIEIFEDSIESSSEIIELNATLRQVSCNWTYKLYAFYKFNTDGTISYDLSLNLVESDEELRVSDATELANLLQEIEEIMNV